MANSRTGLFESLVAGPCAAESEAQLLETAERLHRMADALPCPVTYFRAGVWKPRSSGADFCGAGAQALPWLQEVNRRYGFSICVEVAQPQHVESCLQHGIHSFWVGARTAVNPFAVQELADSLQGTGSTVLIKNPAIPDLKLWLGNVERFEKAGASRVMAVHRGFAVEHENALRNAPLWEIPIAFRVARPDIPLLCDPSHISGQQQYLRQIAQIAIDYGFNGLMVETHCHPEQALSDAEQQITPEELSTILNSLTFKTSQSNTDQLLQQQRNLIHNIDTQISQLLAKRMSLVEEIARIKAEHNIPLVQPSQWNSVVKNYEQAALQDDEYQEFLQQFLEILHQYSLKRQGRDAVHHVSAK